MDLCYNAPRFKPAVPWSPEAASRLLAATIAAVRTAAAAQGRFVRARGAVRETSRSSAALAALAQATRVLSQQLPPPGGHPLRALGPAAGVARPAATAHAWAPISRHADPVEARGYACCALDANIWQWMPVPANCARAVVESGALRLLVRLVKLGGAHAGRCASPWIVDAAGR